VWLLLAALSAGCEGGETPTLSTTTVTPPPSLAVDPCPLNVPTEMTAIVPPGGDSRAVDVITGESCAWTAESRAAFITLTPTSGRGSGTVTVNVQANTGAPRTGSVVVNSLTLTVSQAGVPCAFALSSTGQSFDRDGGSGTVGVTVTQGVDCQWTAASNASFITLTSGSSGTGSGSVSFRVAPNSGAERSGTLTIAGLTFTVGQAAVPPNLPQVLTLTIRGFTRPWCASSFAIQSSPGPNYPSPSAPGLFQHTRQLFDGTNLVLTASGAGSISEWSGCDSTSGNTCRAEMNGTDRELQAEVAESCATPSFSSVSRTSLSGSWTISFTAVNLLPFAGSSHGGVTVVAQCSGFSSSPLTIPSSASGTISSSIVVPVSACEGGGTLSLTDFNGTASTTW
jgi:hypothetical protein